MRRIMAAASPKSAAGLMKKLGKQGAPSWRFWARLALQALPVNARLMKFANSSVENVYQHVYGEDLGPKGRCARCGHEEETVRHAVLECRESNPRWELMHKELMLLWGEEGLEWSRYDWVTAGQPRWDRMWSALGLTPKAMDARLDVNNPAIAKLLATTTMKILQTTEGVWRDRNSANEKAENANEELKDRKAKANRTNWKWQTTAKELTRKRSRVQEALQDQKDLKKHITMEARESAQRIITKFTGDCTVNKKALPHPRMINILRREAEELEEQNPTRRAQKREAAERVSKARKAGSTRDITPSEMTANISDSLPALTSAKRKCYWIPEVGTRVEAFWLEHGGPDHLGTLQGRWYRGKVKELNWPEDKGTPGAVISYDRTEEFPAGYEDWAQIGLFGKLIKAVTRQRKAYHKPHDTVFPEIATRWMGIGTRLRVRHSGSRWLVATVLGTEDGAPIVRYDLNRQVRVIQDIHRSGCETRELKRPVRL
jgi:hypothetical protein